MKKKNSRILSVFLAIALTVPLFSAFSSFAFAQDETPGSLSVAAEPLPVRANEGKEEGGEEHSGIPEAEDIYRINVTGGTAAFADSDEIFSGLVPADSVLEIVLTEQPGRNFLYWLTSEGEKIPDPDFRVHVRGNKDFYPVFEDTGESPFGEWVLVYDSDDCEEGVLYSRTNSLGDVEYRREWTPHEIETVYVNDGMHVHRCVNCAWERYGGHHWDSTTTVRPATCVEEGIDRAVCEGCGHEFDIPTPVSGEHTYGDWEVTEPSVGGAYGKRSRKCVFCGDEISCWYIDIDWKSVFKDHYIEYYATTGRTHEERYYSFTNAEGKDVYVFALHYATTNAYDGRVTWIWTYIDDGDPATLDPVYLSRSSSDNSSAPASFVNAVYGYVYGFDGWLSAIRWQDGALGNVDDFMTGNAMSERDSALLSWADDWVETFNNQYVPVTEDPDDHAYGYWEPYGDPYTQAAYTVYQDGVETDRVGGFAGSQELRYLAIDYSNTYNYMSIHPATHLCVSRTDQTSYPHARMYFNRYLEIVSAEEYALLDEAHRAAYVCVDDIEAKIKAFCGSDGYNSFTRFTLTPAETPEAVRFLTNAGFNYTGPVDVTTGENVVWSVYSNSPHVFRVANSETNPNGCAITLAWNASKADGLVFDRWEKWDFEDAEWKLYSTSPSITVNTFSDPFTDFTVIRYVAHENETFYTVSIDNGWIEYNGENVKEAVVPEGASIRLAPLNWNEWDEREFMEIDHYEDSHGNVIALTVGETAAVTVTGNETYTAVYQPVEMSFTFYAQNGVIWLDDDEANASDAYDIHVRYKETHTLHTRGNDGYTEFFGWYLCRYDKSGEHWEFQTVGTDFEVTVDGYIDGDVYALWGESGATPPDTSEPDPGSDEVVVRVTGGFAMLMDEWEDHIPYRTAYSCIVAHEGDRVHYYDDPSDSLDVDTWVVRYEAKYGDDAPVPVSDKYEEYGEGADLWIWNLSEYATPIDIVGRGVPSTLTVAAPVAVSDDLTAAGYDTGAEIEDALIVAAARAFGVTQGEIVGNYVSCDLTMQVSWDGGATYNDAEEAGYFDDGPQTVYLPYPDGVDPMTHDFFIIHMFDETTADHEAGDTEVVEAAETASGLGMELSSLSPFLVFWQESDWTRQLITGRTLIFGSTYEARYLIPAAALEGVELVEATVKDGDRVAAVIPADAFTEMTIDGVTYLTFRAEGIAAKDIDKVLTLTVTYRKDGSLAADTYEDSILAALTQVVTEDGFSAAMKTAANATLVYCEAAAEYFGRAGADFGGAPVADYTGFNHVVQNHRIPGGGHQITGTSLLLKDELCLKFYIDRAAPDEDVDQYAVELNGAIRDDLKIETTGGGRYWTVKVPVSVSEITAAFSIRLVDNTWDVGASRSSTMVDSVIDYLLDTVAGDHGEPFELRALAQAAVNYAYYAGLALAE